MDLGYNANTYFTVAVYSWSYGLTDQRKHEFRLSLQLDTIATQSANPNALFTEPQSSLLCKEDEPYLDHAAHWLSAKVHDLKSYLSLE